MKFAKIRDIEGFFDAVDNCAGQVVLVTGEGDRLNLKSKLSQYMSLGSVFSEGVKDEIPELEILVSDPEDMGRLMQFTGTDQDGSECK